MMDLRERPLGTGRGENFGVAANYVIPPARIYVINHSRTKKWKRMVIPVSFRRGAEDALTADKELAKIYNVDTLYKRVEEGRDMSRYVTEVKPVAWQLKVGGKLIVIPPARDESTPAPKVEVPEGAWDLYLGNYDRIRSKDATVVGAERSSLALLWSRRHNPVMAFTDDGVTTNLDNPHGFLEFVREPIRAVAEQLDKEYLSALDLVEA
jgi:hypothetical protein